MLSRSQKKAEVARAPRPLHARHQRVRRRVSRPRRRRRRCAALEDAHRGRRRVRVSRRQEHAAPQGGGRLDVEALATHFRGPTAVAFSFGDPAKLAKMLVDYAKDRDHFKMRGAVVEGQPLDTTEIARARDAAVARRAPRQADRPAPGAGRAARAASRAPGGQIARVVGARHAQLEAAGPQAVEAQQRKPSPWKSNRWKLRVRRRLRS